MRRQLNEQIAQLARQGRYFEALPLAEQACEAPAAGEEGLPESLTLLGVLRR